MDLFHGLFQEFRNVAENRFFTVYMNIADSWHATIRKAFNETQK